MTTLLAGAANGVFLVLCSFLCDDAVVWDQGNNVTKSSWVSNIQFKRTELRRGCFELSFACMLTCSQVIKQMSLTSLLLLYKYCLASPATSFSSSAVTKKGNFEPFIIWYILLWKLGAWKLHLFTYLRGVRRGVCVEVREQHSGVGCLILPCRAWGLNSR